MLFLLAACVVATKATLYGYSPTSGVMQIDPSTGDASSSCSLPSSLPSLNGIASSGAGELYFYYVAADKVNLVTVNPTTCGSPSSSVISNATGLSDCRDIKYNQKTGELFMLFPNPNCMHGSLDHVNPSTGSVEKHLNNILDTVGMSAYSAIAPISNQYYYIDLPLPSSSGVLQYILIAIDLSTGNLVSTNLLNNTIGLGDAWDTNYTMSAWEANGVATMVGAASPSTGTSKSCVPSCFYSVTSSGQVTNINGPIQMEVVPISAIDHNTQLFYQVFTSGGQYYLTTYNAATSTIVSTTSCSVCGKITSLVVF